MLKVTQGAEHDRQHVKKTVAESPKDISPSLKHPKFQANAELVTPV